MFKISSCSLHGVTSLHNGSGQSLWDSTCDEVCALCLKVELLHEKNLTERNERKDSNVVGQTDKTQKPKCRWKSCHVTKLDLKNEKTNLNLVLKFTYQNTYRRELFDIK